MATSQWTAAARAADGHLLPALRLHAISERLWVMLWLGVGLILRLLSFGRFPLREDEALYAYWARLISSGLDPMLERAAVDKPPLYIYLLAHTFTWLGPDEAVGRGLNVACSVLALALLWLLARRLYGPDTARWALALYALSPFGISFAATLYTDPMMVMWLLLALLAAAHGRGLFAGLGLGLAFAVKQNALLFTPLILALLLLAPPSRRPRLASLPPRLTAALVRLLAAAAGFYYVWFKVWQWDGWRILPAEIPSFWQQAWNSYGGLELLPLAEWPAALSAWAGVWRWFGGSAAGTLALCGLMAAGAGLLLNRHRSGRHAQAAAILLFTAGYGLGHALFSFQAWDRYLLGLAPLAALLAGRGLTLIWAPALGAGRQRWQSAAALLAVALLLWGGVQAAQARLPVGGDHGAYSGIERVAAYLRQQAPAQRGVIYQRWLGWHWQWYLWDAPAGRVYWDSPAMLVADLQPDPTGYTRFVVFPAWQLHERPQLQAALAPLGLRLAERLRVSAGGELRFLVYQITPEAG